MTPHTLKISCNDDLPMLASVSGGVAKIQIHSKRFRRSGTLRHALKYSLWALMPGGILEIFDSPSAGEGYSTHQYNFWHIRHELFKSIGKDLEIESIDSRQGHLLARKIEENYLGNGITLAIVFGGAQAELPLLREQLSSIVNQQPAPTIPVEILVCGPTQFQWHELMDIVGEHRFRYIPFDHSAPFKRALIGQKKNLLLSEAHYDLVALSHTRICYGPGSLAQIQSKKFDAFTPAVMYADCEKMRRYLDYTLIGSYDTAHLDNLPALCASNLPRNIFPYLRNRVAFIDGGLIVLNKKKVRHDIYSDELSWGEAEDIDLCARLHFDGCLIDVDDRIVCYSQTSKIHYSQSPWAAAKRYALLGLARVGVR